MIWLRIPYQLPNCNSFATTATMGENFKQDTNVTSSQPQTNINTTNGACYDWFTKIFRCPFLRELHSKTSKIAMTWLNVNFSLYSCWILPKSRTHYESWIFKLHDESTRFTSTPPSKTQNDFQLFFSVSDHIR